MKADFSHIKPFNLESHNLTSHVKLDIGLRYKKAQAPGLLIGCSTSQKLKQYQNCVKHFMHSGAIYNCNVQKCTTLKIITASDCVMLKLKCDCSAV